MLDTNKQLCPQLSLRRHFPSPQLTDPKNSSDIHMEKEGPFRILAGVDGACGSIPSILWSLA